MPSQENDGTIESGRVFQTQLTNDGKLDALVREAMAQFKALPRAEQAAHRREQAISWAYGEMRLAGYENVTKEEIGDIIDRVRREEP